MERGLTEKFTDKTSPIKNHTDTLTELGADSKPLRHMNTVTSDVIKVWAVQFVMSSFSIFEVFFIMLQLLTVQAICAIFLWYVQIDYKFWDYLLY